ncbi:DUF4179 domain-containing protein [Sporosarcina cyprini]|uniref:DUF4179 domain-containing protein n=1 Tax=Sporosarcina cyprini TaxID=2910523 RepID=UPI001EDD48A1|nr:DUF4179 domain-containing protein [Sporosarcina cyprini]MCG3088525.1 DUF4179 domain-containing protein [Sporosarcina cyprini]
MKEIYKRFSELKIDPDVVPMPVDETEKNIVKGLYLKKRRTHHILRNTIVAAAIFSLSILVFSASFPALAAQLPIIGNVFSLFQKESQVVGDYGAYTTAIGMSKEDKGVKVTVTDAVYDGESVSISFTMESDRDLGEHPVLDGMVTIEEYGEQNHLMGNYMIEKVNDNQYAGVNIVYLMTGSKPKDTIHVNWKGRELKKVEDVANYIQGDWEFDFELQPLPSKTIQLSDLNVKYQGVTVVVNKMTTTPVSNTIYLSHVTGQELKDKWDVFSLDFRIEDNLGNQYDVLPNGGYGNSSFAMKWRIMTPVFDPAATSIIITPIASAYNEGKGNELELIEEFPITSIEVPLAGDE